MAVILSVLQGIDQTDSVLAFPFLDGLEKLIGKMGKIFGFPYPVLIRLHMKLCAQANELVHELFVGKLAILDKIEDFLECILQRSF